MFDFQSVSSYSLAERRKTDVSGTSRDKPSPPMQGVPKELFNQQDYSTFQFQSLRSTPPPVPPTQEPAKLPILFNLPFLQPLTANMERIASQVITFFFGNRKEKPSDEEKQRRGLSDFFATVFNFLGERKVEESSESAFGDD